MSSLDYQRQTVNRRRRRVTISDVAAELGMAKGTVSRALNDYPDIAPSTGLRNSLVGIVMIYPVTTIPVALYMLQGYFRGLPAEVEEAGLMDGLRRLAVVWKITPPLSLPALASVSLYFFMIAWNEFLLAFMLLDDPSKFTLTRGVAMLKSSEIPRQHLMAGSVMATVPIMVLFLGLERFMTKGLAAGSVKG